MRTRLELTPADKLLPQVPGFQAADKAAQILAMRAIWLAQQEMQTILLEVYGDTQREGE